MAQRSKKVVLFLMGLFFIDYILFQLLFSACILFKNEDYATSLHHPNSDILFLGASHAKEGFDPREIQKHLNVSSYNVSGPSHNPLFLEYQTKTILTRKQLPKLAVITITPDTINDYAKPHSLGAFVPEGERSRASQLFLSYRKFDSFRHIFLTDLYSSSLRIVFSRTLSWLKNRSFEVTMPHSSTKGYTERHHQLKAGEEPNPINLLNFHSNPSMLQGLKNCISLWREKDIPVLIVDTPEFYGTRIARHQYSFYEDLMNDLANTEGVTFVSFNNLEYSELKNEKLFRDGGWGIPNSHLNHNGTLWFNKLFCQYLKESSLIKLP